MRILAIFGIGVNTSSWPIWRKLSAADALAIRHVSRKAPVMEEGEQ